MGLVRLSMPKRFQSRLTDPELSGDPVAELSAGDQAAAARNVMLRRLTAAPRTRSELAVTLRERGICDDVAAVALDRFVEVGLIDDAAFANQFVTSRGIGHGRGTLKAELRRRGVGDEVIELALAQLSPESERDAALALARRRARTTSALAPAVRERRLFGQLIRRGYASSLAMSVVREVLGEIDSPEVS